VSAAGYTLAPSVTSFRAGVTQPFRFRIIRSTLRPVIDFTIAHEKRLHLIVARHDLSGYQHLHPAMAGDGTWSIPLTLPQPGIWRAYAEFVPGPAGKTPAPAAVTLAVDLTVPGDYQPIVLPAAAAQTSTDGFAVAYQGTPQDGTTQPVTMRVYSSGALVTDLQRYLGAYGHLVVLRDGDLAYLHVHPDDQLIGGAVRFWFAAPSPGRFRAFFEFQLAGHVHTAEFTIQVG
jgi:hypothetical protein